MLWEEKEINLINDFRNIKSEEILLMSDGENLKEVLQIIFDDEEWKKWIDSSGKDEPPPDFYNDSRKIMMEVMRVDDHGYRKHGKTKNALREKEHKIEKELKEKGILQMFPNANLIVNAVTDLPTSEDHNYKRYYREFSRTLREHIDNIENYRKNHKGYKLIFFIYDESTAYIDAERTSEIGALGKLHFHFLDKRFVESFIDADIDYIIWMTPYKRYFYAPDEKQPPKATIYTKNNLLHELLEYDEDKMVSAEK